MGDSTSLEVNFEYRPILGEDVNSRSSPWTATPAQTVTKPGPFKARIRWRWRRRELTSFAL